MVEHMAEDRVCPGSSPGRLNYGLLTQLVEYQAFNLGVRGSIPLQPIRAISSVDLEHGISAPSVEGSNPSWPFNICLPSSIG